MTVSEVIQKEHFDVAIQKVLIGNSITSLKTIQRINFLEIFEKINGVEDELMYIKIWIGKQRNIIEIK